MKVIVGGESPHSGGKKSPGSLGALQETSAVKPSSDEKSDTGEIEMNHAFHGKFAKE